MKPGTDISNELNEISPILAKMEKLNVFAVPDGYFDFVAITVLQSIKNECLEKTDTPFPVPNGYFENLAGNILARIRADETMDEIPAGLKELSRRNIFEVPEGYFENLPGMLLSQVSAGPKEKARIFHLHTRVILKYAVAAVLTGVAALGIYRYTHPAGSNANTSVLMAKLDPSIEKGKNMDDNQFNLALASLSEEDIAAYLEKNGNEKDLTSLESVIDDGALPNQDDYLLNEKLIDSIANFIEK